jgi:predicted GNAT family N-acyltransferase
VYRSFPLGSEHDLAKFSSGNQELDAWLRDYADHASRMNIARTFVWAENKQVVAYYTLAAHQVASEVLPHRIARGGPLQIPAVLIGKLALDASLQGQGLGGSLLADAAQRIVDATETVAARLVVVDAVDAVDDRAVTFYEHFGFVRTAPGSLRLVQKRSNLAAAAYD